MKRNTSKFLPMIIAICLFSTKALAQVPADPEGDPLFELVKNDSSNIIRPLSADSNNVKKHQTPDAERTFYLYLSVPGHNICSKANQIWLSLKNTPNPLMIEAVGLAII